jgi:hypothetical protein
MAFIRLVTVFVFLLLSTFVFEVQAQSKKLYKGQTHRGNSQRMISLKNITKNELVSFFLTTGTATYFGDLCSGIHCVKFRPQIGVGALLRTNYFGKRLDLRADVRFFRLYSDDVYKGRNLNFRSSNWEFIASGQFYLFPYEKMMRRRSFVNPYVVAGIGLMTFDPWGQEVNGKWAKLRPLETEHVKYGNVAFVYTAGLGLKFRYTYRWSFMAEGSYRFTTTDYIDDVSSHNYPAANTWTNTQAAAMSNKTGNPNPQGYRGSPKYKDGYFIISVGIIYNFTKNNKPKFHNDKALLRKS